MDDRMGQNDLLFEVLTPLGFGVRVGRTTWELVVTFKHPVMAGREEIVKETLEHPAEVRLSRSDPSVHLFYSSAHKADGFVLSPSDWGNRAS